eukprot:jgi/Botrbrau1/17450/Bobra.0054s0039.1
MSAFSRSFHPLYSVTHPRLLKGSDAAKCPGSPAQSAFERNASHPQRLPSQECRGLLALGILAGPLISTADLPLVQESMARIQKLDLLQWDANVASMDSVLTSLPRLTALVLRCTTWPVDDYQFPEVFVHDGFSRLQYLCITLYHDSGHACEVDGVLRLSRALTGLRGFRVVCDNRICQKLLAYLPRMSKLKNLQVRSLVRPSTRKLSRPSAVFLTHLPQLTHLCLESVLDVKRWEDDVSYFAKLTDLCVLSLFEREVDAHAAWKPLTSAQTEPLTALWQLSKVVTSKPWVLSHCTDLIAGLDEARRKWGLPPTEFLVI